MYVYTCIHIVCIILHIHAQSYATRLISLFVVFCRSRKETVISVVDAAVLLCSRLTPRLTSARKVYIELLKCSYSLVLSALAQVPDDDGFNREEMVQENLTKLHSSLKAWVANTAVIGGSAFGYHANSIYWKAEEEIKVRYCGVFSWCFL